LSTESHFKFSQEKILVDPKTWGAKQLDRHNPVPLYQQLSDTIADAIRTEKVQSGDQLPSENELISLFNVSRFVVRQTLNNLGRQGLIYTEHGRGSFVAAQKIEKPLDVLQSYHESMKKAGLEAEVRIMSKEMIIPSKDIAEKLALKPNEKVLLLERVAFVKGRPLNLLISHIAVNHFAEKLLAFTGGSLYSYMQKECGIHLNHSRSTVEIIFAEEYESRMLNQSRGAVMMQILGVSFDKSGKPIEHSRVVYPGYMFRFQFDSYMTEDAKEPKRFMKP
jgi:GntR family transcriptional regulator